MAQDVKTFDVTIPVGGTAAAPQTFALTMPPYKVESVEVLIPDGVRGVVHFALGSTGTRVIPSNPGAYISGNNEVLRWPLRGYIDSGSWQLHAYNTGAYAHTLQVRFLLNYVQTPGVTPATLIPAAQLVG